jgi:hypothetical protein
VSSYVKHITSEYYENATFLWQAASPEAFFRYFYSATALFSRWARYAASAQPANNWLIRQPFTFGRHSPTGKLQVWVRIWRPERQDSLTRSVRRSRVVENWARNNPRAPLGLLRSQSPEKIEAGWATERLRIGWAAYGSRRVVPLAPLTRWLKSIFTRTSGFPLDPVEQPAQRGPCQR